MRKGIAAGACAVLAGGLAGTAIAVGDSSPSFTPGGTITSQPISSIPANVPTGPAGGFTPGGTITSQPISSIPANVPTGPAGGFTPGGTITSQPVQTVPSAVTSATPPATSHPTPPKRLRHQLHHQR